MAKWDKDWKTLDADGKVLSTLPADRLIYRFRYTLRFTVSNSTPSTIRRELKVTINGAEHKIILDFRLSTLEDPYWRFVGGTPLFFYVIWSFTSHTEGAETDGTNQGAVEHFSGSLSDVGVPEGTTVSVTFRVTSPILIGKFEKGVKLSISGIAPALIETRTRAIVMAAPLAIAADNLTGCRFKLSGTPPFISTSFPAMHPSLSSIPITLKGTSFDLKADGMVLYLTAADEDSNTLSLYVSFNGGITWHLLSSAKLKP